MANQPDHETPQTDHAPRHQPGARKGEEIKREHDGGEPGRHEKGDSHGSNRPAGGRTSRDSTGINPEKRDPDDPRSPNMPPG